MLRARTLMPLLLISLMLCILSACAGGALGTAMTGDVAPTLAGGAVELAESDSSELPGIPLDREASEEPGDPPANPTLREVLGNEYLVMHNGTEYGTSLILEAPGSREDGDFAWAIYQISDMGDLQPQVLSVFSLPGELYDEYWVGIANYTRGVWDWYGPASLVEYEVDLTERGGRYVTHLGNFYFILVLIPGNTITHLKSTLICGEYEEPVPPGAPTHLQASDGEFPDGVGVWWLPGNGAEYYEIWRQPACWEPPTDPPGGDDGGEDPGDPGGEGGEPGAGGGEDPDGGEWQLIGTTEGLEYFDCFVVPEMIYLYKARSVGAGGYSGFSNIDEGWAGGPPPPPPGYVIEGAVFMGEDHPLPGIGVQLLGPLGPRGTETDERGGFRFGELVPGTYIVVAAHPELWFEPVYHVVHLGPDRPVAEVFFHAREHELPLWRLWGFVYALGGEDPCYEGCGPLAGVKISIEPLEGDGRWVVETNEHGYWHQIELPLGTYVVTPAKEGYRFEPAVHDAVIDGVHVTPPLNFFAFGGVEPPPPHGEGVIEGTVAPWHEGIAAILLGLPHVEDAPVTRDGFRFGELPWGRYLVTLHHRELDFEPWYRIVELGPDRPVATVEFACAPAECMHQIRTFCYWVHPEYGYHGIGGAAVVASKPGTEDQWVQETDANGFARHTGLPGAEFIVRPHKEPWFFDPEHRFVGFDGENLPPPQLFMGYEAEPLE